MMHLRRMKKEYSESLRLGAGLAAVAFFRASLSVAAALSPQAVARKAAAHGSAGRRVSQAHMRL
jgi:hypothetical protein